MAEKSEQLASQIRREALKMVALASASHIGGSLSVADIMAVLYQDILKVRSKEPQWVNRDRFILSKCHCCSALYATLALQGFLSLKELETYGKDRSRLMAHVSHAVPGVEFSTGSLGHGLPYACGKAVAAKRKGASWRAFTILSDGELDEGSNWEAILFAPQHKLDNLVAIVDYNKIQSLGSVVSIMDLDPLAEKFRAFRWSVKEVDGHNHSAIKDALATVPWVPGKPSCLIAHTVKGKGVPFMENELLWHYKSPEKQQLDIALGGLNETSL